jgi:intein-encoded DNA endonuclease-like protein
MVGKRKKVTDKMVDEFVRLYVDKKYSLNQIAKKFGVDNKTVKYHLEKRNIKLRGRRKEYEDTLINNIVDLYTNKNYTIKEIADRYHLSNNTVRKILLDNKVPIRMSNESRMIRREENVSLDMDDNLSYILGVLEGDGYVIYKSGKYLIGLSTKDYDFAKYFYRKLTNIGLKPKTHYYQTKNKNWSERYIVECNSKKFCEWYFNLNKYDDYYKLLKEKEHKCMFLRGMFDSEGSVKVEYKDNKPIRRSIRISNTNVNLIKLCCDFLTEVGIKWSIHKQSYRKKQCYDIYIKAESFEYFKSIIGSSIKRKMDRLNEGCKIKHNKHKFN